jgi:hypothetical protein
MFGSMMRRYGAHSLMVWVACLLTFGASGDDFNMVRLLLPAQPSLATSIPLPLDDPNTDFTLASKVSIAKDKPSNPLPPVCTLMEQFSEVFVALMDLGAIRAHCSGSTCLHLGTLLTPLRC